MQQFLFHIFFLSFFSFLQEKAGSGSRRGATGGKKADAKPASGKRASQAKKTQPQDDKQEFSELRGAIDGKPALHFFFNCELWTNCTFDFSQC